MQRLSRFQFVYWLRTGRVPVDPEQATEVKFNPNHDPKNGQFTFAGEGGPGGGDAVLRTVGLPVTGSPNPQPQPQPQRQARTNQTQRARPQSHPRPPAKLKPIRGYSETGADSWRAANDQVFIDAANKFNGERGLKPGDPKYVDPQMMKAWAMVESGGSKEVFLRDPLQVNNPGDYNDPKPQVTGLEKGQLMTPEISAEAALKWLDYRGYERDKQHRPGPWLGLEEALQRYNGRKDVDRRGIPHRVWYAHRILSLYNAAMNSK